ncbi:MAG: 1,6-anhydro-N-acetylmuramyl-L-alanine amidase AmpD [Gammaproteobacteria bacterium]|nr:1,6-anhydro-N-acetylmuramyl-L-alanine amidase AmpD [Gammaproteobacteria bacterium]
MDKIRINLDTGLLNVADFCLSPNHDLRPEEEIIDLLVIHNISLPPGEFSGDAIEQFFMNTLDFTANPFYIDIRHMKVSAHLLIRRDGRVKQFVPFHLRAWHAGESQFESRARCNDFSIGIELEGADDIPYTSIQYAQLSAIAKQLMKSYPGISFDRIVGHCTIAPHRKTDPGPAFDWGYFFDLVEKEVSA